MRSYTLIHSLFLIVQSSERSAVRSDVLYRKNVVNAFKVHHQLWKFIREIRGYLSCRDDVSTVLLPQVLKSKYVSTIVSTINVILGKEIRRELNA